MRMAFSSNGHVFTARTVKRVVGVYASKSKKEPSWLQQHEISLKPMSMVISEMWWKNAAVKARSTLLFVQLGSGSLENVDRVSKPPLEFTLVAVLKKSEDSFPKHRPKAPGFAESTPRRKGVEAPMPIQVKKIVCWFNPF